jgi:hypothetical protein
MHPLGFIPPWGEGESHSKSSESKNVIFDNNRISTEAFFFIKSPVSLSLVKPVSGYSDVIIMSFSRLSLNSAPCWVVIARISGIFCSWNGEVRENV